MYNCNMKRYNIYIDEQQLKQLKLEAKKKSITVSSYIRMILAERPKQNLITSK